jgi:putative FmdB family regulatory protein
VPLYEYRCVSCRREFEDLSTVEAMDSQRSCPSCGKTEIERKISTFGIQTTASQGSTLHSPKEIDKAIGAATEKSWEGWNKYYDDKRKKRREGKDVKELVINKGADGKVTPFEHLGTPKEQAFRKNYAQEYKAQIADKGKDGSVTPVVMKTPDLS